MKTTVLSMIVGLGFLVAGISGVSKADHYYRVVENQTVRYIDECNNLITVIEPVVVRYRYSHVYDRPLYNNYIQYPYYESWRYANSKPRGLFGFRYRGPYRY
jgi:hypothetical protein